MGLGGVHTVRRLVVSLGMAASLLGVAAAAATDELPGDQWVGHDPTTGIWTMPDGRSFYYGDPSDQPIMCDWDGDGLDTVGLYRSRTGFLHLRNSNDQGFSDIQIYYGVPEDLPVCGDWNGDGVDTIGIYRPSESRFYLRNSNTQGFADLDFAFLHGAGTPVAGDWDGDGIDTVGLHNATTGAIALADGNTPLLAGIEFFGEAGDTLLAGDWNGDGLDMFGVIRGDLALLDSPAGVISVAAGVSGNPVAARVNGSGPNASIISPDNGTTVLQGDSVAVEGMADATRPVSLSWHAQGPDGSFLTRSGPSAQIGPLHATGTWTIHLEATDDNGVQDPTPAMVEVLVQSAPPPLITAVEPADGTRTRIGNSLDLTATATGAEPLTYVWTFGGSSIPPITGRDPEAFYPTQVETIDITLSVIDRYGRSSATSIEVEVAANAPPDGTIESPAGPVAIPLSSPLAFTGSAFDPDGDAVQYLWTFGGGASDVVGRETGDIYFATPGTYTVTLHVIDELGLGDPAPATLDVTVVEPNEILINAGEDIQSVIDANPGPNTFILGPGIHRGQSVRLYDYQTLTGIEGAILSGAEVLSDWQYDEVNDAWYVEGQTQQGRVTVAWVPSGPVCRATNPRCRYPEDLFIDGQIQRHVEWMGDLADGTWWFDYDNDRIWVKYDPRSKFVETSVVPQGVYGGADHVTVRNLIVEKFATPTQIGAVDSRLYGSGSGPDGTNWTVDNVEARFNHGTGIFVTDGGRIINSNAHHNGQQGFSARGYGVVVENSQLSHNNTAGYHWDFEAGGGKYYRTYDMVFRNNWVHDNYGSGVWFDIANFNALIEDNTVENNDFDGIFYEVSYGAVIRNNLVLGNGFEDHRGVWLWGAGIIVASSSDVEIYGNEVRNNWNAITAVEQQRGTWEGNPRHVTNLWVHDNLIAMDASLITHDYQYDFAANGYTGLGVDYGDTSFYTSRGNRFESNDYEIPSGAALFHWMGVPAQWEAWQGYGQDLDGSLTYNGVYTP